MSISILLIPAGEIGGTWSTLEDACNVCITLANKGKAMNPKCEEMETLGAYIKSFSGHHWKKK